jgi:putative glutamine amidotransferase
MSGKPFAYRFFIFLLAVASCQSPGTKSILLVSRDYDNRFTAWPAMGDTAIEMVSLYHVSRDSIDFYLSVASGMIISGGPDVNPALYGKESDKDRCGRLDPGRDTLELKMIRYAVEHDIPLLCICRGHQILNVANRGSLVIDIPADYDTVINHARGKHMVRIVEETLLSEIVQYDSGIVNSSHHQAVELLAPGFRASAFAPDGIIEAIEPVNLSKHPFMLGVQWHPETMIRESSSPLSVNIAVRFIKEVRKIKR